MDFCVNARHACSMDDIIDTRGMICPLPVLRLAKVLRGAQAGTIVTIWADDPIAVVDIPHYCVEAGHDLLSQSDSGPHQIYIIKSRH